jgi:hypothetical protein
MPHQNNQTMKTFTKLTCCFIAIVSVCWLITGSPAQGQTIPLKPCLEHFTSSSCPPCASFAPVFRKTLAEFNDNYTIIRYQMYWPGTGDPYYFAESKKRRDYYEITGVPGLACNGAKQLPYAQSFSREIMQGLVDKLTGVRIDITASVNLDEMVTATITITPEIAYPAGLVTQIVVMEGVTTQNATTNGEKGFDHVAMGFMPNADGTVLPALVPGQPVSLTYTLDMKTTHRETLNDLLVAAFIQDNSTKQIVQSNNASVSHPYTDYLVTLNVIDNDYNVVKGGKAFIPWYGENEFGADGLVTFKGVFPGTLDYEVVAPGYEKTTGDLTVTAENVLQDVILEKPDLFFYEDFGWSSIPEGWNTELAGDFMLLGTSGEAGSLIFYKPSPGDDNSYLILPAVNLNQTGIFSFRAGVQSGLPELKVGIVTLEAIPGTDGTEGFTVAGFEELYSAKITRAEGYGLFGFPLPETIGNKRLAFKFAGPAGSYCELDQVAILEDFPGVKVQFVVTDQNDEPLKNTTVTLSDKSVILNAYGYATFRDTDPGSYVYMVTYKEQEIASGILNVEDALVKEIRYNTTGVESVIPVSPVSIYPNPVRDHFFVQGVHTGIVSVFTPDGQQVMQLQIREGEPVSTRGLAKGLYLVRIQSDEMNVIRKVLISR